MAVSYTHDPDLLFLEHCSEHQLTVLTHILTHGSNGKPRLTSSLLKNQEFTSLEGQPNQHQRSWRLIAGELQHYGGNSIANKIRGHGKAYRAILLDVCKQLKLKRDKEIPTWRIEQTLLEHFLRNAWQKMDDDQKQAFFDAIEKKRMEIEALLPQLMEDPKLAQGVSHLLADELTRILRTQAALKVLTRGVMRGVGLAGPIGAAFTGITTLSGSASRVTIPAVLHIACLRRINFANELVTHQQQESQPAAEQDSQ